MPPNSASALARYGIALASIAVAIAVRWTLTPWLGGTFPLATVFTAIPFVVWWAGVGPALVTTIGGWLAGTLAFRAGAVAPFSINELVQFLLYLVATLPTVALGHAMRKAQRSIEQRRDELSTTNLALESKVEAQSLLAAIVASSDDAIISKTLDGIITSWNRGAEQLFGWKADEAIGGSIHLVVPPEMREQERDFLQRLRRGERIERRDVIRVRKDSTTVPVSLRISPVYDRHGHIIGASSTASDITHRKAWEEQLVRSEEAQRLLVGIHDATRGIEDASVVMREIVTRVGLHFDVIRCAYGEVEGDTLLITRGYTKNVPTVAGRYDLDTFGPALAAALRGGDTCAIEDVRTDPLTATPTAQQTYAAMQIVSMVVVPVVRSGRLVAVMVMCADQPRRWGKDEAQLLEQVAERTLFAVETARAAAALREHRDVMTLAMSTARMGAWTRDMVHNTMWWSPEFAELCGFNASDANVARDRLLAQVRPEDRERLPRLIAEAVAQHRDYVIEYEFQHARTGEWRWMESRGRAEYGPDGRPTKLYGLVIDVTERRRAVEALKEADRRKDEFLATLAHELRNPLAPISAGLHILRSRPGSVQSSSALEVMERQVGQMVRLVDDLLDVARITTGKVELRCEPLDIAAAIHDAIETSAPVVGPNRITLAAPPQPIYVNADRTRLAQVFANLLNNAAKYSAPHRPIAIGAAVEDGQAVVRVRDQGIGIQPEMLPRIFEMFRQVERSGGWTRGGLGIGLSLVKRIVELHGGTVTAQSEGADRGSEFTVRIPAVEAPRFADSPPATARVNGVSARRKILVVDDNEDAAESLATLLTISGHETRMAHDGNAAVQTAEAFHPDVVFLDIGMPTIDGHETARMIRQQPWGKDVVLVALTGWGQLEDRRRSKDAGFNHHLVKPADPMQVEKLLSSL